MKIKESFNDTHLIDIELTLDEAHKLIKKGGSFFANCPKSETEVFVSIKRRK